METVKGLVFDIKKFAIHDGPGIRTTVFVKGCPLKCLWCHNPESQEFEPEISLLPDKCIGCGYCFEACPGKCHVLIEENRQFLREQCQRCGICTEKCYAQALELIGRQMTADEVVAEVMKDKAFYETSNGGMTISGGEPMSQYEFTKAVLADAKAKELHTCLDTCGYAPTERYQELIELGLVDIFLYDYKETDEAKHLEYTGVPLKPIIENLRKIDTFGAKSILRCPIIPGLNDREDHFVGIAKLADSLSNILHIDIHPYHPLGESKSERIGKQYNVTKQSFPEESTVQGWLGVIRDHTTVEVKTG